ncbi:MAG: hypothetical protein GX060_04530 [Firmicutes bacterium]|nr:hypothetical protein [Bacillota bacterium]
MKLALLEVIADLHVNKAYDAATEEFLQSLATAVGQPLQPVSQDQLADTDLPLIFIRSGGTEGLFKALYESLPEPYLLLTTGHNNSLAASLEILTFLRQQGKRAEILHGSVAEIAARLEQIIRLERARRRLQGMRIGIIGEPSDWLIASDVDTVRAQERLGVQLIKVSMQELQAEIEQVQAVPADLKSSLSGVDAATAEGALRIYLALKQLVEKYEFGAITVRCFDLLGVYQNTGCIALAMLNDQGITAGCEGDVATLLSMVIMHELTGEPVFMANPSQIDVENNEIIVAHCTVPLSMTESYALDTHFESGLGIGVRGRIRLGLCTAFKLAPDLEEYFLSGGEIMENLERHNLCRTQLRVKLDQDINYFLTRPLGNHHVFCRGDHTHLLREFLTR